MTGQKLKKSLVGRHQGYRVFSINALAVRNSGNGNEEFGNFATHDEFPRLIGKDEIWIADHLVEREGLYYLANASSRLHRLALGQREETAYEAGEAVERYLREQLTGIKYRDGKPHRSVPKEIYVEPYVGIPDHKQPMEVWRVDGHLVRCYYKTDYTEGGHGYVYDWVPKAEIWVERDVDLAELPVIVSHEYTELRLMRDCQLSYDRAHEICSKIEFDLRQQRPVEDFLGSRRHRLLKADLPRLTSPEFFQYVLEKYVR